MKYIKKLEIYYADLEPVVGSEQGGIRPVLIIQNNLGNKHSPTVVIAPITNNINDKAKIPTHIFIKAFGNIKYDSIILIEQSRVIDKKRLYSFVDKITDNEIISKIEKAILIEYGIKNKFCQVCKLDN